MPNCQNSIIFKSAKKFLQQFDQTIEHLKIL